MKIRVEIAGVKESIASARIWALTLYIALAAVNLGFFGGARLEMRR